MIKDYKCETPHFQNDTRLYYAGEIIELKFKDLIQFPDGYVFNLDLSVINYSQVTSKWVNYHFNCNLLNLLIIFEE